MNVTNPNKNGIEWSFLSISTIHTINTNPKKRINIIDEIFKKYLKSTFSHMII